MVAALIFATLVVELLFYAVAGAALSRALLALRIFPFGGIREARLGSERARRAPGRCAADMAPGGEWLARLEADEKSARRVPVIAIFSLADELVVPAQSGHLEGARNIPLERLGHLGMLLAPQVHATVEAEIVSARNARPSGA